MMHFLSSYHRPSLPDTFCWTRFGSEAGEPIDRIIERKEAERVANGGVFLWGIGNSVGPGVAELLARNAQPEVLFSPIKSRPRPVDTSPSGVVHWSSGETLTGDRFLMPGSIRITSHSGVVSSRKGHYALVCASDEPLRLADWGQLRFGELCNLRSGNPLGSSQVTAIVGRNQAAAPSGSEYTVAMRAMLVAPYFVRLRDPISVEDGEGSILGQPALTMIQPDPFWSCSTEARSAGL